MVSSVEQQADEAYRADIRQDLIFLIQHGYGRIEIQVQDHKLVQVDMTKRRRRKSASQH